MGYGEETLVDEGKVVAAKAVAQGVHMVWEQWEAMPHCFGMIFEGLGASKKCFGEWAAFCDAVGGRKRGEGMETRGVCFTAKTGMETQIDVRALGVWSDEEVKAKMDAAREARHLGMEGEAKILP